jgi:predicted alpha/beta-fold hydrolase
VSAAYRAPRLFANPHFATIYAGRIARTPEVAYRRERWDTPDGDFIDLDFVDGPASAPLVVLFHGLEGSSQSSYARVIMDGVRARGWRGVVPHFRGCSGELNRLPRAYHSGDSAEADWILRRLIERNEGRAVFAAGVSLGGNVLAKWLGERGAEAQSLVRRAVAICAPVDLPACGHALGQGFGRVYTFAFLRTLKARARLRLARHPGTFDGEAMERSRTLRAFDDAVTAPLHGFDGVDDYWTRAASKPWLGRVEVPLLLINPKNDPFLPEPALPASDEVASTVVLEYPDTGGHVAFLDARGALGWLPERVLSFFDGADPRFPLRRAA